MIFWLNVLSIGAAAWFTWLHAFAPLWGTKSLYELLQRVSTYSAFAFAGSILNALCAYLVLSRAALGRPARLRWNSGVWFWYAPALLLGASFSPASLTGSLILLISVTRALALKWAPEEPDRVVVAPTPQRILVWRAAIALGVSLTVHAAVSSLLNESDLFAAGFLAISVTSLTALSITTGAISLPRTGSRLPSPALGALLTMILATGITVVRVGGWGEGFGGATEDGGGGVAEKGKIRGVILTAEAPRISTVVAPVNKEVMAAAAQKDLSFPFSGEYWIYRVPFLSPPAGSLRQPGSPFDLSFSTTDRVRMRMQARQRLEEPLAIDCCRALKVLYRAQELRPSTVSLEVRVADGPETAVAQLGTLKLQNGEHSLEFPFPDRSKVREFREIQLYFYDTAWLFRNPKVQIRSFAFVKR